MATNPTNLGPGLGLVHYPGPVVRVDPATGQIIGQIADPQSCLVEDIAPSGDFVCIAVAPSSACCSTADLSVRRSDGSEIWRVKAQPNKIFEYDFISPDEQHVLANARQPEVVGRDGTDVRLVETVDPVLFFGWLDSSTVVGTGPNGNLSYVSLTSPGTLVDMRVQGQFVGAIS